MAIFLTADTHFNQEKILEKVASRQAQFETIQEMNQTIIENWNQRVGDDDIVYHLGDVCHKKSKKKELNVLLELNGKITVIKGNHELKKHMEHLYSLSKSFSQKIQVSDVGLMLVHEGIEYYLTHFPTLVGEMNENRRNFHGHIHSRTLNYSNCLNVGIDSPEVGDRPFGAPILLEEAIAALDTKISQTEKSVFKDIIN